MSQSDKAVTASYTSPAQQQVLSQMVSHELSTRQDQEDPTTKTQCLTALRDATTQLQTQVNTFLTERMEEDKLKDADTSRKSSSKEDKAEEMYGEEDPEDDT